MRVGKECLVATEAAEIEHLPAVLFGRNRVSWSDLHTAYGVFHSINHWRPVGLSKSQVGRGKSTDADRWSLRVVVLTRFQLSDLAR